MPSRFLNRKVTKSFWYLRRILLCLITTPVLVTYCWDTIHSIHLSREETFILAYNVRSFSPWYTVPNRKWQNRRACLCGKLFTARKQRQKGRTAEEDIPFQVTLPETLLFWPAAISTRRLYCLLESFVSQMPYLWTCEFFSRVFLHLNHSIFPSWPMNLS